MIHSRQILNLPDEEGALQTALQGLVAEGKCVILESAHLGEKGPHLDTFDVKIDPKALEGLKERLEGLHIEGPITHHTT
ncbi:hypothetical protein KBB27_03370 [Patescibacteria group bacterium]|nr:hypothetical protein [Patescibacteria group bacterium]